MVVRPDDPAGSGGTVARSDVENRPRRVRPAVMDVRRQHCGGAARQGRGVDVDLVMCQLRPDGRIERDTIGGCGHDNSPGIVPAAMYALPPSLQKPDALEISATSMNS